MEQTEQEFNKGFNNGYLLAKYEPEVASMLVKDMSGQGDYFQGLVAGKQEYELNKSYLQVKDNDRAKDVDDIEKER
jgi:hypothetical protein